VARHGSARTAATGSAHGSPASQSSRRSTSSSQRRSRGPFSYSANLGGHIADGLAALVAGNDTIALYAADTDGRQRGDRHTVAGGAFAGRAVI
jgi:hypothetical protein